MADAHVLDLTDARAPLWWQLQPVGAAPRPRFAHSAAVFGSDLMVTGGMPPPPGMQQGIEISLLNLVHLELRTSAPLAERLRGGNPNNCSLMLSTAGSPTQVWSCGTRLLDFSTAYNLTAG